MPLVEERHPTGLREPKAIAKIVNGTTAHFRESKKTSAVSNQHDIEDDSAVLALRNLIFDICNQNGGGHGGSAIGMAAIGVALYKYVMRYNPSNPDWFDRDRFVLSNGMLHMKVDYCQHVDLTMS